MNTFSLLVAFRIFKYFLIIKQCDYILEVVYVCVKVVLETLLYSIHHMLVTKHVSSFIKNVCFPLNLLDHGDIIY